MKKQSGFAHILLVMLLVAGFAAGIYLVKQKTDILGTTSSSIVVLSPNGGEVWPVSSMQNIKWSASPDIPKIVVSLVSQVPPFYNYTLVNNETNDGSFDWTVAKDIFGNTILPGIYKMRISDPYTSSPTKFDDSDTQFTISSNENTTPVATPVVITPVVTPTHTPTSILIPTPISSPSARVDVVTSCSGSELHVSVSGDLSAPSDRNLGLWSTLTDGQTGQSMIYEYDSNQGSPVIHIVANFPPTGSIRGVGFPVVGDGRTYTVKVFAAPYTGGIPVLVTPMAQTTFSKDCTVSIISTPTPASASGRLLGRFVDQVTNITSGIMNAFTGIFIRNY